MASRVYRSSRGRIPLEGRNAGQIRASPSRPSGGGPGPTRPSRKSRLRRIGRRCRRSDQRPRIPTHMMKTKSGPRAHRPVAPSALSAESAPRKSTAQTRGGGNGCSGASPPPGWDSSLRSGSAPQPLRCPCAAHRPAPRRTPSLRAGSVHQRSWCDRRTEDGRRVSASRWLCSPPWMGGSPCLRVHRQDSRSVAEGSSSGLRVSEDPLPGSSVARIPGGADLRPSRQVPVFWSVRRLTTSTAKPLPPLQPGLPWEPLRIAGAEPGWGHRARPADRGSHHAPPR